MDYVKYIRGMVGNNKIIMNASGGIIARDNEILLQKRSDNGLWGLFGGIMEMGETYSECAIREIKEETGLDVNLDYLVGIYHNKDWSWPSGDKAHVICAAYKCSIINGEVRKDNESLDIKWFNINDLPEIGSPDHRQAISDYINGLRNQVK